MTDYYPLFWLKSNNFGDALGPWLYEHITGRQPVFSNRSPRILSCGSILGKARKGDVVWGSGYLTGDGAPKTPDFRVHALRGPLSAAILEGRVKLPDPPVYGDPALLVHRYASRSEQRYDLGFFPHYTNVHANVVLLPDSIKLKPMAPVAHTISRLTTCKRIVSSALHGIVVAESFGIPAVWVRIGNSVPRFKFRDYYLGTGREPPKPVDCARGIMNWNAIDTAFDRWTLPCYSEKELLACCPFDIGRNEYDEQS